MLSSRTFRTAAGCVAGGLTLAALSLSAHSHSSQRQSAGFAGRTKAACGAGVRATLAQLPLAFEGNRGQVDSRVRYLARGSGYSLFLTADEAVLRLRNSDRQAKEATVRMRLAGANHGAKVAAEAQLPGRSHYYLGSNPKEWRRNVERFSRVRYRSVYQGVDLVYYGRQGELEYDFIVQPGADPEQIRLEMAGAENITVSPEGDLVLQTAAGELRQHRPYVYQEADGKRREIPGRYLLASASAGKGVGVAFDLADYDRTQPLVIDPVLSFSTYLGGNGADLGTDIEVDAEGYIYVTGRTASTNFPLDDAVQGYMGGGGATGAEGTDTFVTKLTPTGDALVFSTYLGGTSLDLANGLALDSARSVYVTGQTSSFNFPVQAAIQPQSGGAYDVFLTKLDTSGLLVFSTYLGGASTDVGWTVLNDGQGGIVVGGGTFSLNFPTMNALQGTHANTGTTSASQEDAFVTKLSSDGSAILFSTYLGGTGRDSCVGLALDPSGNLCVGGETTSTAFPVTAGARQPVHAGRTDAFFTKLTPDGSTRLYATFFGGNYEDRLYGFGVDGQGNVYFSGHTFSTNLPTTFGAIRTVYQGGNSDGFLAKLNAAGNAYVYVTYLGGSGSIEYAYDVAPDAAGNVYVVGYTDSYTTFPLAQPFQQYSNSLDAFVMRLGPTGGILYSTYLSGMSDNTADHAYAITADAAGNAYVTGRTYARNWPLVNPLQSVSGGPTTGDAFVVKLSPLHTFAPTSLQATALTPTDAGLSWTDNSNNESGFSLERSTNAINYTVIATLAAGVNSYVDPDRTRNATYWYRVRAFNPEGYTDYASNAVTMPKDPPAAPSNLTVTAVSSSVLRLNWTDNSSNETRFDVLRSQDGVNFALVNYPAANATTYDDSFLAPDTLYYYIVTASNEGGSTPSNTASGRTWPTPPAAPSNLVVQGVSSTTVQLGWQDNSATEESFRVRRTSSLLPDHESTVPANATSFVDTGLHPNTTYAFQVYAYTQYGSSASTPQVSALTLPAAPSGLAGSAASSTRIELTWTDNNTFSPAQIEVDRSEDSGATFTRIATAAAGAGGFADTSVLENRTYQYRVRAINATGASAYTDVISVATPLDPPAAPTNLSAAYSRDYRRVNLIWTDRSSNEAGFELDRSSDGGATWTLLATLGAGAIGYGDAAWQPDATHSYRVRAFNAAGASAYTEVTTLSMPPAAPSGLTAATGSSETVLLTWMDNSSQESAFVIERKTGDGAWLEARVVAANATQATDLDLSADTLYTYRVRARNLVDVSTPTNEASARTLPNPPAPPNGLTVQALTQGALSISWTDNSNNEDGFQVEQWDGSQFNVVATLGADATAYNHTGLAANTYYIYQVQAFNAGGLSGSVQTVGVYTLPSAPANLTVATVSQSALTLSWTDTNPSPSGHEIERSTDGVNFSYRELVGGGVTTYQDTGLLAGTRYYYRLRAVNGAGPSPYSNIASASTQVPSPPAAPSNLTGTALSSTQVRLSWRDNSANETEFRIELSLNGKAFTQIGSVGANVIQFTSTGLAGNTKYWFRVRAANTGGTSGYSNVINLRTPKR